MKKRLIVSGILTTFIIFTNVWTWRLYLSLITWILIASVIWSENRKRRSNF